MKKQIEEMAKVLCKDCAKDPLPCELTKAGIMCDSVIEQAEALYNAGYHKASDVAREILTEIENILHRYYHDNKITLADSGLMISIKHSARQIIATILRDIAELKKKYTEDEK